MLKNALRLPTVIPAKAGFRHAAASAT